MLFTRAIRITATLSEDLEHPFLTQMRDSSEVGIAVHSEVEIPVKFVHGPDVLQSLDVRDHCGDRLNCPDVVTRRNHLQSSHILAEELGLTITECDPVIPGRKGPLEQWVVNIGDVLHVVHIMSCIKPVPVHEIKRHIRRGVSHVGGVVRRDPADVHRGRFAGLTGPHRLLGCVVET